MTFIFTDPIVKLSAQLPRTLFASSSVFSHSSAASARRLRRRLAPPLQGSAGDHAIQFAAPARYSIPRWVTSLPLLFSARLKIHRQNVSSSSASSAQCAGQPLEDVDSDGDDDREDEGDGDGDKLLMPWTAQPADLAEWLPLISGEMKSYT